MIEFYRIYNQGECSLACGERGVAVKEGRTRVQLLDFCTLERVTISMEVWQRQFKQRKTWQPNLRTVKRVIRERLRHTAKTAFIQEVLAV